MGWGAISVVVQGSWGDSKCLRIQSLKVALLAYLLGSKETHTDSASNHLLYCTNCYVSHLVYNMMFSTEPIV